MLSIARNSQPRSITPDELRALLRNPAALGNKQAILDALTGSFTEEEVDAFERRINALNEHVDEIDEPRP